MDGLKSGHYWDENHVHWNRHKGTYEWSEIQKMQYIEIYEHSFERI